MKIATLLIIVMVFPLTISAQFLKEYEVGPYFSNHPWIYQSDGANVILNSDADYSPVPSEVNYSSGDRSTLWTYGIIVKPRFRTRAGITRVSTMYVLEFGGLLESSEQVSLISGGVGVNMNYGLSDVISWTVSGLFNIGYFFGHLGTVGDASGDEYLEAPDGNIYYSGSDIEINKLGGGITIQTGLQFDISKPIGIRFDVGYRYWGEQEGWNYEVTDGSNTSELPASGFTDNPFTLDIAGLTYRIGLLYRIDK